MDAALLCCSIALAAANNYLLHRFSNRGLRGPGDVLLFNAAVSAVWIVVLLAADGGIGAASPVTLGWGAAYGAVTACFLLSKMTALASGPIALTSLVGCCSLVVPTLFSAVFLREPVGYLQITGLILLLAAAFLCANPKRGEPVNRKWGISCLFFFLFAGSVGVIFKLHQLSTGKDEIGAMMITASAVSTILLTASAFAVSRRQGRGNPALPRQALPYAAACGLVSCGYNRLNLHLSGALPGIVFFPIFNGSIILIASLLGCIVFHEKLKKTQTAGLLIGTAAIMMIGKVFGA